MDSVKLKQLIDKKNFSVNDLLSGLLPKAKTRHITTVLADRLNKKGLTTIRGGRYFASSVQNTIYHIERKDANILNEVIQYLFENGVTAEMIEDFELETA